MLRRTLLGLVLTFVALSVVACLDDSPLAPNSNSLRLALNAEVAPQEEGEWRIGIRVFYRRTNQEEITLTSSPTEVVVEGGTTTTQDVSVQLGPCLTDEMRVRASEGGCSLIVVLQLLDASGGVLSSDAKEVHASAAGVVLEPPSFNLVQPFLVLTPGTLMFDAVQGGALPNSAAVGVSTTTGAALGTISVSIAYQSGSGWLQASASASQLTLRPSSTNLTPGTYQATVSVSSSTPGVVGRSLPVSYAVSEPPPTGGISGTVRHSQTGGPVTAATVELRAGANNTTGTPLASTTTSANGTFTFSTLPAGTYTLVAKASGFVDGSRGSVVVGTSVVPGQDIVLSPTLPESQVRIVLTWGPTPADLDAHLIGPNSDLEQVHICWADPGSQFSDPFAFLDVDDRDGSGPETVTIYQQFNATYSFFVFDYTNTHDQQQSTPLSASGARVQVFRGSTRVADYPVPSGQGNLWSVFTMNGTTLTPINTLGTTEAIPPDACSQDTRLGNGSSTSLLSPRSGKGKLVVVPLSADTMMIPRMR